MKKTFVTVAEKEYPVCFSMGAMEKFIERYGSMESAGDVFDDKDYLKALREIRWMMSVLIEQGCRKEEFETGEKIKYPSENQLEFLIGTNDIRRFEETIVEVIKNGNMSEVDAEDLSKNVITT